MLNFHKNEASCISLINKLMASILVATSNLGRNQTYDAHNNNTHNQNIMF